MKLHSFMRITKGIFIFLVMHTTSSGGITIKPFRACRANNKLVGLISCQDYNMISLEQAKKIAQANPISFVHIARPEVDCPDHVKPYDPEAGIKGYENLQDFLHENLLKHDEKPALYVYGRIKNNKLQTGIVGLVNIDEYSEGNIKRHEEVIQAKEKKLSLYTELQQAQVDPVLLLHEHNNELSKLIENVIHQTPHQAFYSDRTAHVVWAIRDKKIIDKICMLFKNIKTLYIGDGHHRTAAAAAIKDSKKKRNHHTEVHDFYMAGIFPFEQVTISSYNRVFKDLNNKTKEEFLQELNLYFDIEEVSAANKAIPLQPQTFGIYCQGTWCKATLKDNVVRSNENNPLPMLDIAILSNLVLKPFLNIDIYNPDKRTEFVGGVLGLDALEKNCKEHDWPLAIAFFPVRSDTFSALVNEGGLMPPKTTWFEPKVRPGLFTYTFDCCSDSTIADDRIESATSVE
ncbi:DUF1015 domain-containing protein [Candidatus Dependentiae bacterium]|nr:DUF1015 domain-containing protein [Candidatus Dependentiae bacterium]